MTRLTSSDVLGLGARLEAYDLSLKEQLGASLKQIACRAAGITEAGFDAALQGTKVAVIPVTAGEGIIEGFVELVQATIAYLGCECTIPSKTDVAGMVESLRQGSQIAFMADDYSFVAVDFERRCVVDNGVATGRGFVEALNCLAQGLARQEVLVIGGGCVGSAAVEHLLALGAKPHVYDTDITKLKAFRFQEQVEVHTQLYEVLPAFRFIIDATPQANLLDVVHLHPEALIAAPGMPLGLNTRTLQLYSGKVIHDPLQLGVAVMLAMTMA